MFDIWGLDFGIDAVEGRITITATFACARQNNTIIAVVLGQQ